MSKIITLQNCGIILDVLYRNSLRASYEQKSLRQCALDSGVSVATVTKIRDVLIEQKLLVKEGDRRNQRVYWHPDKSAPNPVMLRNVYSTFIKDAKHRVKLNTKKEGRISLERALQALVKLGYTGVITRSINAYAYESIDLSKIQVGN